MKSLRSITIFLGLLLVLTHCEDAGYEDSDQVPEPNFEAASMDELQNNVPAQRVCATMNVLYHNIEMDPALEENMARIERFIDEHIEGETVQRVESSLVTIPVVVHVLYRTSTENISLRQIRSQIDVLNEDFNADNSDIINTPNRFRDDVGNFKIEFRLARVTRTYVDKRSWGTNDEMKKPSKGGVAPIKPRRALNIWVVNRLQGGVLGYAQFPGGALRTDGVVIAHNYFGRTGRVSAPFNLGRTGTHEVGHWLNLYHIWGDGGCQQDDRVSDTPLSNQPNYDCPDFPTVHCQSIDMTMNYMDYTNDACMYMFTKGQKRRALAVFASGGPRAAFANN